MRRRHRFERQVAFGIDRHRSVVEVRRPDAQQPVVDHHQLGMNLHVDPRGAVRRRRVIDPQPVPAIGRLQPAQQPIPVVAHCELFQMAMRRPRHDDDHLGTVPCFQPAHQFPADDLRRQILRLEIDAVPCRGERVEVQALDLAHQARIGTGDGGGHVGEIGREVRGPGIDGRPERRQRFSGLARPALARMLCQHAGSRPSDDHLQVMHRPIGLAGRGHPLRMVRRVIDPIPPVAGEIDPADECQGIVDHDQLRVVGTPERRRCEMMAEVPVRRGECRQCAGTPPIAAIEDRPVPQQEPDFERGSCRHQRHQ